MIPGLEQIVDALERNEQARARWFDVLMAAANARPSGTKASWFVAHDGAMVDTLQWDMRDDRVVNAWLPGSRTVGAGRTYAKLNGSRTDYAGWRVLAANDAWLLTASSDQVALYQVAD